MKSSVKSLVCFGFLAISMGTSCAMQRVFSDSHAHEGILFRYENAPYKGKPCFREKLNRGMLISYYRGLLSGLRFNYAEEAKGLGKLIANLRARKKPNFPILEDLYWHICWFANVHAVICGKGIIFETIENNFPSVGNEDFRSKIACKEALTIFCDGRVWDFLRLVASGREYDVDGSSAKLFSNPDDFVQVYSRLLFCIRIADPKKELEGLTVVIGEYEAALKRVDRRFAQDSFEKKLLACLKDTKKVLSKHITIEDAVALRIARESQTSPSSPTT